MATAPTRTLGHVDDAAFGALLADALEHVEDCQWPASVNTYAIMRRDPQLAAVLAAYTLLIRRASWTIDPAGCRPEVARLVADDLGLPVAGADRPSAARVRGVSWRQHLRQALESLTFGHMAFELQADTSSGRARLAGLWERQPWTITQILVDPKTGALDGITQEGGRSRALDVPQIPADRLAFYANDRNGANWAGVSLLRPAYGAHLIKREMQRVLATSNRRFGMGVPTIEWANGTNPTPAQMSEAQRAVTAARVGDQAGLTLPPGASLVLRGLDGSVPATLEFLKWLDSQMSGMALARFMDLGDSPNGSRALGETFTELFTLAVQSVADDIADTATRHVAARLVDWNWGLGEPVPAVRCSDVRSRREVTAEALKTLLDAGALSTDPALEEYVRREWRLPERTGPPPASATAPANSRPAPATRTPRRPRSRQARGQAALFAATGPEGEPQPDPQAVQDAWEQALADLLARWPEAAQPMVDDLAAQVESAVAADDLGALGTMAVSAAVLAALGLVIGDAGAATAAGSVAQVVAEAVAQGVTIVAPDGAGEAQARAVAEATAGVIAGGYATGAARTAILHAGPGAGPGTVAQAVRDHLTELGASDNGWVGGNLGAALPAAQNAGRRAALEAADPQPVSWLAVEVNDTNRCKPCAEIADTVFDTLAAALAAYPAAGYRDCDGGLRCRGYPFPRWR